MLDPRLAEIDFLMTLEQADSLVIKSTIHETETGAQTKDGGELKRFGLSLVRFRDMVVDLMLHDVIVGHARRQHADKDIDEQRFMWERRNLTQRLIQGLAVELHLSRSGRVHLWNLRDALLKDPDLEPFGLRSRAAWERELFVRLRLASDAEPVSLILLDLDHFGVVNRTLGMPTGDAVLRVAFSEVKNLIGTRGAVYRIGGEEVGVLLPATEQSAAAGVAEELRAALEVEVKRQVPILAGPQTASIGVKAFAVPGPYDVVVGAVDELVRAAKRDGRNRVVVAT